MEADRHRVYRAAAPRRLLHLGRPVHLEPDQEPDRRRHGHVRGLPAAVDHHVDGQLLRPDRRQADELSVDHRPLRRLRQRRHRYHSRRVLPELYHLRAVPDREVRRQRTVEGLMLNRILNLVGYLGMALVAASLAIRFGYPAKEQWAYYLAWSGLVCVLLYTLSQCREIGAMFSRR